MAGHIARVEIVVDAPPEAVWRVITATGSDPDLMFGAEVVTDWQVGSRVIWRGVFEGKEFEDSGTVVAADAPARLVVDHFSPLSGEPDVPDNHHVLEYRLTPEGPGTRIVFEQDNNPSEQAAEHSAANWSASLAGIKKVAERDAG
jgi:uncharacterized protein YndB with AHSA1/START domain